MNNVTRWNPFREIAEMQRQLDRVFDDVWNENEGRFVANWMPIDVTETEGRFVANWMPIDVTETETGYNVIADLPGLNVEDINVNFHDGVLTISGEVHETTNEEGNNVLVRERTFGKFSRRVNLPASVDVDAIEASYNNGVLTLALPKAESAKPRQIQVRSQNLLADNS